MKVPTSEDVFGITLVIGLVGLILGGLGFGGYSVYGAIHSNGEIDYCYIEMISPGIVMSQFQLIGHRPWRSDRVLGSYATLAEAKTKADLLACPIQRPQ